WRTCTSMPRRRRSWPWLCSRRALSATSGGPKRRRGGADKSRMITAMAPELSVVIPVRNEAPALKELHREFTQTLAASGHSYELIIVDDGSTDDSFEMLARLQASDPRLRVIRFRRNFGQTAAFA